MPGDTLALSMGEIEGPTGLRIERHICVADQGDYHAIGDGPPQEAG